MDQVKQFRISLAAQAAIAAMALGLFGITGCTGGGDSGATGTKTDAKTGEGGKIKRPPTTAPGNSAKGDTIPIGLVTSLSGDNKPWGDDCKKGAEIAVDDFNAAGGVNGKKIDLKVSDSGSKPEVGKSAAEKRISGGVLGLVGEVASGITMQMGQAAFEKGIPVVAVGATRTDLADIGNNMFRVCYTDDFQGPVMANFAYTELGLRNIAIITDKKLPYSTGLSDSFHATFTKLGGKIIDEQFYETGNKDFKGQLTNVKAKNPDGLFMSGYFTEVGPLG
ncbi:MAG: ABC transporter substrate-binding protein [Fimbriimonas ginsengisoli]|nr:ABC transporter substrate-binding protein [Fimbriimonas ginsengisoli]